VAEAVRKASPADVTSTAGRWLVWSRTDSAVGDLLADKRSIAIVAQVSIRTRLSVNFLS
jgi:hypothetical protein